jgi:hypothetical protein
VQVLAEDQQDLAAQQLALLAKVGQELGMLECGGAQRGGRHPLSSLVQLADLGGQIEAVGADEDLDRGVQ